jgi:hypothetical protein
LQTTVVCAYYSCKWHVFLLVMPCTCVQVEWNHPQIWSLMLFILKMNVCIFSITNLLFYDICSSHVEIDLESMFQRSLYDNTYKNQFIIVQLTRANTTFGCFFFTQSKNVLLSWTLQQSIMHISFNFLSIKLLDLIVQVG